MIFNGDGVYWHGNWGIGIELEEDNMHTPGPWTITEWDELTTSGERRPASYISASNGWAIGGRTVAIVGHWTDRPNPEADARLIAAAPDLLEALEYVAYRYFTGHCMTPDLEKRLEEEFPIACEMVYSAIEKAKGG